MQSFQLDGETAIVTGASRGIGRAAALALAEAGADVVVLGNSTDPAGARQDVLACGRRSLAFQGATFRIAVFKIKSLMKFWASGAIWTSS